MSTSPIQFLALTDDDRRLIREFYGIDRGASKFKPKFSVGQIVSDFESLPDEIVQRLPQLKGLQIARDPGDGSVLLLSDNGRIIAVVQPA